ncbi:MAG: radical SAM protein [Deferrisomatales bacterium]|nr:radical SAM protein [Deferrisomatales bacterium]
MRERNRPLPGSGEFEPAGGNDPLLGRLRELELLPPKTLKLMVTGRCNLSCRHCWPACGPNGPADVPLADLQRVLEAFVAVGGEAVCLTGGEPLVREDWRLLVSAAGALPGLRHVEFQSNGVLLDEPAVEFLCGYAPSRLEVQLSLDGAREETNDRIRGLGTFRTTLAALERFRARGEGRRVVLAMTETGWNFREIPELLRLAEEWGVRAVQTGTLVARGRGSGAAAPGPPTPEQVTWLLERWEHDPEFRARYERLGSVAAIEWAKWRDRPRSHYCTFIENLFVDAAGNLYPCTMYDHPEAAVPGVFSRPLGEAILEGAPFWSRLREQSRLRLETPGPCAECAGWRHCRGGCFGRRAAPGSGEPGREDRCGIRRAVYGQPASGTAGSGANP